MISDLVFALSCLRAKDPVSVEVFVTIFFSKKKR